LDDEERSQLAGGAAIALREEERPAELSITAAATR
jgi:hypothetical protein